MKICFAIAGDEIWTKITHIRDERKRACKKIKMSKKSGAGTRDVYRPSIWFYDLCGFLEQDSDNIQTTNNLQPPPVIEIHSFTKTFNLSNAIHLSFYAL